MHLPYVQPNRSARAKKLPRTIESLPNQNTIGRGFLNTLETTNTGPLHKVIKLLAFSFYCLFAAALALHCYRNTMFSIDLLGYAGNVASSETADLVHAHSMVYQEPLTPHLRGTDTDDAQARILRRRASDPYYSTLYLPYFSVKPLYIVAMEAARKSGVTLVNASRAVSAICFFGIALALWTYTRSALALVILILPETLLLGQANEPDGMSVMLLLWGLWAVFAKDSRLGFLPLLLAVWARPDNAILCLAVAAFLWALKKVESLEAVVFVALAVASAVLISHFGYGWRSLYFHTFLGGEPGSVARFTATDYLHALGRGILDALHSTAPIYVILWALCIAKLADRSLREILLVAGVFSLIHFVIFPNYEARYYGLFFVVTAAVSVRLLSESLPKKAFLTPLRVLD